ncbi:hypothetical protein BDY21DRAFT_100932 [Lineolata rhizophorae]|uniref:Uncharacterized protein n=1 Tax=Lineolata rhizophorae TaxID=578093 RepID=A0A6A6NSJ7_9PEZI|nr:hypothetical protein BDY21DRAFT_100932 [Lineolata rhizophorae]
MSLCPRIAGRHISITLIPFFSFFTHSSNSFYIFFPRRVRQRLPIAFLAVYIIRTQTQLQSARSSVILATKSPVDPSAGKHSRAITNS